MDFNEINRFFFDNKLVVEKDINSNECLTYIINDTKYIIALYTELEEFYLSCISYYHKLYKAKLAGNRKNAYSTNIFAYDNKLLQNVLKKYRKALVNHFELCKIPMEKSVAVVTKNKTIKLGVTKNDKIEMVEFNMLDDFLITYDTYYLEDVFGGPNNVMIHKAGTIKEKDKMEINNDKYTEGYSKLTMTHATFIDKNDEKHNEIMMQQDIYYRILYIKGKLTFKKNIKKRGYSFDGIYVSFNLIRILNTKLFFNIEYGLDTNYTLAEEENIFSHTPFIIKNIKFNKLNIKFDNKIIIDKSYLKIYDICRQDIKIVKRIYARSMSNVQNILYINVDMIDDTIIHSFCDSYFDLECHRNEPLTYLLHQFVIPIAKKITTPLEKKKYSLYQARNLLINRIFVIMMRDYQKLPIPCNTFKQVVSAEIFLAKDIKITFWEKYVLISKKIYWKYIKEDISPKMFNEKMISDPEICQYIYNNKKESLYKSSIIKHKPYFDKFINNIKYKPEDVYWLFENFINYFDYNKIVFTKEVAERYIEKNLVNYKECSNPSIIIHIPKNRLTFQHIQLLCKKYPKKIEELMKIERFAHKLLKEYGMIIDFLKYNEFKPEYIAYVDTYEKFMKHPDLFAKYYNIMTFSDDRITKYIKDNEIDIIMSITEILDLDMIEQKDIDILLEYYPIMTYDNCEDLYKKLQKEDINIGNINIKTMFDKSIFEENTFDKEYNNQHKLYKYIILQIIEHFIEEEYKLDINTDHQFAKSIPNLHEYAYYIYNNICCINTKPYKRVYEFMSMLTFN